MHDSLAIKIQNVSKVYKLYGSKKDQFIDVLKLQRFGFKTNTEAKKFTALDNVSLDIRRGERVGIIGRNGAGKTTLLKLIGRNFEPTTGQVEVHGKLQALMSAGLGFHPEFTGRENIYASLQYNELSASEFDKALASVVDFCELGEFLDQPFKSYSLGMQSRLQFACATAIHPDILIVDEVLGAGDVYFSVKSSNRMEKLAHSGCTLLLVSHSMQQILQFCDRAIWVDGGKIVRDGDARAVVTEYEKFMFDLSQNVRKKEVSKSERPSSAANDNSNENSSDDIIDAETIPDWFCKKLAEEMTSGGGDEEECEISENVSRWVNDERLKIVSARLLGADGKSTKDFISKNPFTVEVTIEAQVPGDFDCWHVVLIYGEDGKPLVRNVSKKQFYSLREGERRKALVLYNELLLGEGEYHVSVAIYRYWNPDDRSASNWYEILNRSIKFKVYNQGEFNPSLFYHPHQWLLPENNSTPKEKNI